MSDKRELSISEIYKNKAEKARNDADRRCDEVYLKDKRIEEIDKELSGLGMAIFAAATKDDEEREAEYKRLETRLSLLREERKDRLKTLGLPGNYTDVVYECPKCSDTGYIGIKMCDCLKKTLNARKFKNAGIGKYLQSQSFDNFDLSLYPFGKIRNAMSETFSLVKKYAESFSEDTTDSLLFVGATGLGKTHLSSAVAKAVIEKGFTVYYDSAQNIISTFEKERFLREGETLNSDKFFECDLLIIDDLGAEVQSRSSVSYFYTLINTRLISGKPVIISTNLGATELKNQYEARIVSRLFGEYKVFLFEGDDLRNRK